MFIRTSFANVVPAIITVSALAIVAMGCDGASVSTSTSTTQPLTAELNTNASAQSFELTVSVSEPSNAGVAEFEHREHYDGTPDVEAGLEFSPNYLGVTEVTDVRQAFAATVDAMTNNQYVAEKEVHDAVTQPFFTSLPLTKCEGVFPCELTIRIDIERFDFSVSAPLLIHGHAWVDSDYYDVEILDVASFPTF
ncbi:MAG: hypothetical protein ACPGU1_18480 [Myxococcota bacterium]